MTTDDVLDYVKSRLGAPYVPLEYTDEQILRLINLKSIPLFSKYLPDKRAMVVDFSNPDVKTDTNVEFILADPDELKILNVVELIPGAASLIIAGHPIIGLLAGNPGNMDEVVRAVKALQISDKQGAVSAGWPKNELIQDRIIVSPATDEKMVKNRLNDKNLECYDWWFCHKPLEK